jgi:EAL domain-containing protein (putative c-di-GMP-specific phosphodiesterase class I)
MPQIKSETPTVATSQSAAESLGWQLRGALPPLRLHSVSIFDPSGDVLWLSEGVLGPDEQGYVAEALSELEGQPSATHCDGDFHDGRGAVFLPIRTPGAPLSGLVMILVDGKALSAGALAARVMTSAVQGILERLSVELSPPAEPTPDPVRKPRAPAIESGSRKERTAEITLEILAPQQVDEILTFELPQQVLPAQVADDPLAATDTLSLKDAVDAANTLNATDVIAAAPAMAGASAADAVAPPTRLAAVAASTVDSGRRSGATAGPESGLRLEELAKLRPGGRLRRFCVLPSALPPGTELAPREAAEALVSQVQALLAWLGEHSQTDHVPLNFSFAVTATALDAEDLPGLIGECLGKPGVRAADIGFEIEEAAYLCCRPQIDSLVRMVETLGSFLVVDDFSFDSGALELLRSKTLRLVKVHPELVAAALRDKLAQARIVAISQAARVLGIHCAAKNVDTQASRRWLAAAGFDFAEGPLFDAPRRLESLAAELAQG